MSDGDGRSVGDVLLDVTERLRGVFTDECRQEGLTMVEGRALRFIARGADQAELGPLLGCGGSRVSAVVDRLQAAGLVERRRSRTDHRRRDVTLTTAGCRALDAVHRRLETSSPLMAALDDGERTQLELLLRRLERHEEVTHG